MRYGWIAVALAAGLLLAAAGVRRTSVQAASYEDYEGKSLGSDDAKKKLEGQKIAVKDLFGESISPKAFPVVLTSNSIRPSKFLAFRTQPGYGSDMLCVVPKAKKEAVEAVRKLLPGGKVLLCGTVRRAGASYVFVADDVVRGWVPRPKPRSIIITVSRSTGEGKTKLRLPEPGKTYRFRSPYGPRWIHISYEFE